MATANTMAGILHGTRQVEVTINGSAAPETLRSKSRDDPEGAQELQFETGINTTKIYQVSRDVSV